jgi:predicted nuclease with TOPRIM domain
MSEERAEKFLELFNKGKEFTEELLRENQRLRYRVAALETEHGEATTEEIQRLRAEIQQLTEENRRIQQRFREVEEENKDFANRYSEGEDVVPGIENLSARLGDGILGGVAKTGESYYINQDVEGGRVTLEKPLAAVPLKIKEHVIGLIAIYKLLQQKDSFSAVDYELFSLLAAHAATAIFSSKLYSQSERKLNTIQSFLDLLTTTS